MNKSYKYMLAFILIFSKPVFAQESSNVDLHGFVYKNEPINPNCVKLLQSWMSDYGIIIRSIVIDTCQDSNLAFNGRENINVAEDGTVSYYEDPNDGHTYFSYKVLGVTSNGIYVLQHLGEVAFYRVENMKLRHYFNEQEEDAKVITKLTSDDSLCFVSAKVYGNVAEITKSERDGKWCGVKEYSTTYDLNDF